MWAVLTTRSADADPASFYRSREQVMKALKRRYPDAEYCALVEFTTGYGPRSGGKRRPHWNLLLKGIPDSELPNAAAITRRIWCARENARPAAQHVGLIREAGGLMRYLALHFQKESQAPPEGWRGHRFMASRGFFQVPLPELREQARDSLRFKRELHRALAQNLEPEIADIEAQMAHQTNKERSWELVEVYPGGSRTTDRERRQKLAAHPDPSWDHRPALTRYLARP